MARLPRLAPIRVPQHIIQRGNNRQHAYQCLFNDYLNKNFIDKIRAAINRGLVVGSEKLKDKIESKLNYSVRPN